MLQDAKGMFLRLGPHIIEQSQHNRLIRPSSIYIGEWPQAVLDRRKRENTKS